MAPRPLRSRRSILSRPLHATADPILLSLPFPLQGGSLSFFATGFPRIGAT